MHRERVAAASAIQEYSDLSLLRRWLRYEPGISSAEMPNVSAVDKSELPSDTSLPGAGQAGALHGVFDAQAGLAGFGLRTETARYGVQKRPDHLNVRVRSGNFRFDPIDQFEDVVLITARESERTDRVMHGSQGLMYFCQLLCIHAGYFGLGNGGAQARRLRTGRCRSAAAPLSLLQIKTPWSTRRTLSQGISELSSLLRDLRVLRGIPCFIFFPNPVFPVNPAEIFFVFIFHAGSACK